MTRRVQCGLLRIMPYRKTPLVSGEIYHVFNRGVAKLPIFYDKRDYNHLLEVIYYYQFQGPKPKFSQLKQLKDFNFERNKKIVEILCYCLMPNHYHFLIRQLEDNGLSEFISKLSNSYTKYFNIRHERVGPLLQGQFKAKRIEDDEQLIHVSRYIHLNPLKAFLVKGLKTYQWSSYPSFIGITEDKVCAKGFIASMFKSSVDYEKFVLDYADYQNDLDQIEHLTLE